MPMDIETITINEPTFQGLNVYQIGGNPTTIQAGAAIATQIQLPARIVPNVSSFSDAQLLMDAYGPGSVDYAILNVVSSDGENETPVEIDPKTYIDNYGIIHVGPGNMSIRNGLTVNVITFTATYHYINPSTGEVYSQSLGNFKIVAIPGMLNNRQEDFTAIPYTQQPAFNG